MDIWLETWRFFADVVNSSDVAEGIDSVNSGAAAQGVSGIQPVPAPDLFEVIKGLLSTTFGVVGIIAVVMIIIGGFHYMTSQGSPEKVQKGKNTILYGIIGLIICLSAFAIVNFILASLNGA